MVQIEDQILTCIKGSLTGLGAVEEIFLLNQMLIFLPTNNLKTFLSKHIQFFMSNSFFIPLLY